MSRVVSIFNQKGGVGKTTTSINLSAGIGKLGYKVLLVDLDPQGNSTSGLGVAKNDVEHTIYDVLALDLPMKEALEESSAENVDLIPANSDLAGLEVELAIEGNWQERLKDKIDEVRDDYDYIFIDCPPSLGVLSIISLIASNGVIIPIQCEYYALEGVSELSNTINLVKENFNPDLEVQGVVLSMFDGRTNLSIEVVEDVKEHFKGKVYTSIIPRNVRLAEAPSHGLSIMDYDNRSTGAQSYMDLSREFIELDRRQ